MSTVTSCTLLSLGSAVRPAVYSSGRQGRSYRVVPVGHGPPCARPNRSPSMLYELIVYTLGRPSGIAETDGSRYHVFSSVRRGCGRAAIEIGSSTACTGSGDSRDLESTTAKRRQNANANSLSREQVRLREQQPAPQQPGSGTYVHQYIKNLR